MINEVLKNVYRLSDLVKRINTVSLKEWKQLPWYTVDNDHNNK